MSNVLVRMSAWIQVGLVSLDILSNEVSLARARQLQNVQILLLKKKKKQEEEVNNNTEE